jgi:hypothetical protein
LPDAELVSSVVSFLVSVVPLLLPQPVSRETVMAPVSASASHLFFMIFPPVKFNMRRFFVTVRGNVSTNLLLSYASFDKKAKVFLHFYQICMVEQIET